MKIVVTGGAGFIGSHIAEELAEDGHEVRVIDILHPWAHEQDPLDASSELDFHRVDLNDVTSVASICRGADAVCHQASLVGMGLSFQDASEYVRNNCLGTATLLQALDGVGFAGRFVMAGSMVVYGEGAYECRIHGNVRPLPRRNEHLLGGHFEPGCPICGSDLQPQPISEDLMLDPRSVYAATKLHQEHLCTIYGRTNSVPVALLRYHNVYGPRMPRDTPYAGVASIFLSALRAGRRPQVFEDGKQMRDFIHVRDVARANVLALTRREPPTGPFNISTGHPRSVTDLALALAASIGESVLPDITGEFRLADVRHVFASPARARRELGFSAKIEFDEGMQMLAAPPIAGVLSGST